MPQETLKYILNDITNDIHDLKVGGLIKHFLKTLKILLDFLLVTPTAFD